MNQLQRFRKGRNFPDLINVCQEEGQKIIYNSYERAKLFQNQHSNQMSTATETKETLRTHDINSIKHIVHTPIVINILRPWPRERNHLAFFIKPIFLMLVAYHSFFSYMCAHPCTFLTKVVGKRHRIAKYCNRANILSSKLLVGPNF